MRQAAQGGRQLSARAAVTGSVDEGLLRRFAAQFAAAVADGSELHEVPGFRVHLWPTADPYYRNVAVPIGVPRGWPSAIAAMMGVFAARSRQATVEFFEQLRPDLPAPLEAAGFELDARGDVMALRRSDFVPPRIRPHVRLLDGMTPMPLITAFLRGAAATFGDRAALLAPGELERFADGLARGTIAAAVVLEGSEPVGGASVVGRGRVAELAGVWTHADWRRRGLALAICVRLLEHFFAAGGEVLWLSTDEAASASLYRRLGFAPCGRQLNYIGPVAAA